MHTVVGRGHAVCPFREVVRSSECPLSEVPLYTLEISVFFSSHRLFLRVCSLGTKSLSLCRTTPAPSLQMVSVS